MAENITLKNVRVKHKIVNLNETITDALEGELFLSQVTDATTDPVTGELIPPAYVIRVGTGGEVEIQDPAHPDDPTQKINPTTGWLHAPASDVYAWAKNESIEDVAEFATLQEVVSGLTGTGGTGVSVVDLSNNISKLATALHTDATTNLVTGYTVTYETDGEGKDTSKIASITANTIAQDTYLAKATYDTFIGADGAFGQVESAVSTLIGADTGKSIRDIANDELAASLIPEDAAEAYDTLQEIAAWIQAHPADAAAMNQKISDLETKTLLGTDEGGTEYATVKAYVEAYVGAELSAANTFLADLTTGEGVANATAGAIQSSLTTISGKLDNTVTVNVTDSSKKEAQISALGTLTGTTLIIDCN